MRTGPLRVKPGRFEEVSGRVLAPLVPEEVVRGQALRLGEVVDRAVEPVRPGLDADAGDAALGVAELGVESRGLHLELLDEVGGRDVGRDDLVLVRGGRARRAVDQQVAAVAARPVEGEADDVGRLVGPVQALAARVGEAGREAHDLVRVAVDQGELRDSPRVHGEAHVRARRVEDGALRGHVDRLLHAPDLEHDGQVAGLADLDLDLVLDVLLEAGDLDRHLVGAGEEEVEQEQPLAAGRRGGRGSPCRVGQSHRRPGDRGLRGVRDAAGDPSAGFLGAGRRRKEESRQCESRHARGADG